MSRTFALIDNGDVVNTIVASEWPGGIDVTNTSPRPGIGWTYDGSAFSPPGDSGTTTTRMTHFKFLSRFTKAQRLEIRRRTNEGHPQYDDTLDDALFLFNSAQNVDVALEMTQQLVGYMAMTGLIDAGDMSTLLAPIAVTEEGAVLD